MSNQTINEMEHAEIKKNMKTGTISQSDLLPDVRKEFSSVLGAGILFKVAEALSRSSVNLSQSSKALLIRVKLSTVQLFGQTKKMDTFFSKNTYQYVEENLQQILE